LYFCGQEIFINFNLLDYIVKKSFLKMALLGVCVLSQDEALAMAQDVLPAQSVPMVVIPHLQTVGPDERLLHIPVEANVAYDTACSAAWITLSRSVNGVYAQVAANESESSREAEIVFANAGQGIRQTYRVVQQGRSVSPRPVAPRRTLPLMGWSSWNTYHIDISDSLICRQADAMVKTGLKEVGYHFINIDDGYFGGRDDEGNLITHPERFPKGLKEVVDHIHSLGLKAGIYTDAGHNTCGSFWENPRDPYGIGVGMYEHDAQDAEYFFGRHSFDFIKVDYCGGIASNNLEGLTLDERERYTAIHDAIQTVNPEARINICRWAYPGTWVAEMGDSWRISHDITNTWGSVKSIISLNRYLSAYASRYGYNDMDMLEIGRGLSEAEERTHFGLWCIQSSPLLIGCDLTKIPEKSFELITNRELIALNQDTLGLQARIVKATDGVYLYVKDVETLNGRKRAVAIYNSSDKEQTFRFAMSEVDLEGRVTARDLFTHTDAEVEDGEMTLTVSPHDTKIYRLEAERRLERSIYEGETAWLQRFQNLGLNRNLGYADYGESADCSGGAKAQWLGHHPDNWLEWRDVYSLEGGDYEMTLAYVTAEQRTIDVAVNGRSVQQLAVGGTSWSVPATVKLNVHLEPGCNTIRLSNPTAWMPDIDCMTLRKR